MIERYIIHSYYNTLLFLYNYNAKTDVINLHLGQLLLFFFHFLYFSFIDGIALTMRNRLVSVKQNKKTYRKKRTT